MRIARILAAAAVALSTPLAARAQDRIELGDGTALEGRIVYEDEQELILRYAASRERTVKTADVKSVHSLARSLRQALDQWERLAPDDVEGTWELAMFCRDRGLAGEAALFAWLVVLAEPEHGRARALLGHERRGGTWRIRDGLDWLTPEQLFRKRLGLSEGWVFTTLHYSVQTNLSLREALAVTLDLERYYRFFFDSFGRELRVFDVTEPMHAVIHGDYRSFVDPGDGRTGWFDAQLDTLVVLAENGVDPRTLYHEATHQLVHDTTHRHENALDDVPAWVREGLATYMESSGSGPGGRTTFELGKPARPLFAAHTSARAPFDLARMFALTSEDFMLRTKAPQQYAQAYTLVHFCMHGEGGRYRSGFLDYLRSAYQGLSSLTDFQNAIPVSGQEFEKRWNAYAASQSP